MKFLRHVFAEIKIRCLPDCLICIIYIFLFIICWLIIQLNDFPLADNWQAYIFNGW